MYIRRHCANDMLTQFANGRRVDRLRREGKLPHFAEVREEIVVALHTVGTLVVIALVGGEMLANVLAAVA